MTCTVIKENDKISFICYRGHKKTELTTEDQKKIAEVISSISKERETICDICGRRIVGIENFINAGDKVVCSEKCLETAKAEFTSWLNKGGSNFKIRKEGG